MGWGPSLRPPPEIRSPSDDETLIAYRSGEPPRTYSPPDVVSAAPVLTDFSLDLRRLFGHMHDVMGPEPDE